MKRIASIIIIFLSLFNSFTLANDNYLLIYKPNQNLKYKIDISAFPESQGAFAERLYKKISEQSIITVSINKSDEKDLLNIKYNLDIYHEKSCCNPLTYPGFLFKSDNEIKNLIKPSGYFVKNEKNDINVGCIFGFNLYKIKPKDNDDPIIIPCYFPETKILIKEKWNNLFIINTEERNEIIEIIYSMENVISNIAYIEGNISDNIFIESHFDIEKGYWIDYKMYYIQNAEKKYFRTFELM